MAKDEMSGSEKLGLAILITAAPHIGTDGWVGAIVVLLASFGAVLFVYPQGKS